MASEKSKQITRAATVDLNDLTRVLDYAAANRGGYAPVQVWLYTDGTGDIRAGENVAALNFEEA